MRSCWHPFSRPVPGAVRQAHLLTTTMLLVCSPATRLLAPPRLQRKPPARPTLSAPPSPNPGGFIAPASGPRPYLATGAGALESVIDTQGPPPAQTGQWVPRGDVTNLCPSTLLRGRAGASGTHATKSERKIQKVWKPPTDLLP